MAKLILKQQEPPQGSWFTHYSSQVAYAGFIALLLLISLGILFAFKPITTSSQALPRLDSATNTQVKSHYLSDWQKLEEMRLRYEQLAKTANTHDQALVLLNQAEMAWQHLLIMSESTDALGLNDSDKKQLLIEQSYLQDQWQARIHFSELRLDRFSNQVQQSTDAGKDSNKVLSSATDSANAPAVELTNQQAVAEMQPSNKYIVQPPAGVELPAGFCTLNGSGTCKPDSNN